MKLAVFTDSLRLELTSAEPDILLSQLAALGIPLSDVRKKDGLTFLVSVPRNRYARLAKLCKKRGDRVKLLSPSRPHTLLAGLLKRPVLLMGLLGLAAMWLYLPTRVLFLSVEGNQTVPANQILWAAQESGLSFGARRRSVSSERLKNQLLSAIPELEWVGVNTRGCTAVISVRERDLRQEQKADPGPCHIVAGTDGRILSFTATQGSPVCQLDQQVKKGDILVSGYTDNGTCIQMTHAEAEVFAETERNLEVLNPTIYELRGQIIKTDKKYSLILGKKRINLWKSSRIYPSTCGRIYEEKNLTLPGGFRLPVKICKETYLFYDLMPTVCQNPEALSDYAQAYLLRQMNAGRILDQREEIHFAEDYLLLSGSYLCQEMIAKEKAIEIGEIYG